MESRNCGNRRGLSDDSRAVTKYTDEVIQEHKVTGAQKVFSLGNIRLYECPLTYVTAETWEIIGLINLMEDSRNLLFSGGWAEQPAWLIETIQIAKTEVTREIQKGNNGGKKP